MSLPLLYFNPSLSLVLPPLSLSFLRAQAAQEWALQQLAARDAQLQSLRSQLEASSEAAAAASSRESTLEAALAEATRAKEAAEARAGGQERELAGLRRKASIGGS